MKRLFKFTALAAVVVMVLSACGPYDTLLQATGGGWMPNESSQGNGKATFGVDITCNTDSGKLNGEWVYHDKASGINAHGYLTNSDGGKFGALPCELTYPDISSDGIRLDYVKKPCHTGYCKGLVRILFEDTGEVGPEKGDALSIDFLTGPYWRYDHSETLGGGNLTYILE